MFWSWALAPMGLVLAPLAYQARREGTADPSGQVEMIERYCTEHTFRLGAADRFPARRRDRDWRCEAG
jgi:hypothetical protein